ncbi:MAG TPA: cytochrome c [Alphaproteobacteria bacterium]|jgi:mono/diheme cytochrome c family protein
MKQAIERATLGAASALAAAMLVASLASPAAAESGNAARGRALAERFCAKCHAVAPGRTGPEPAVPSFMRMAADPEQTRSSLRQFITLPHYEMEPQTLTSVEIDDVIAYILSLRR